MVHAKADSDFARMLSAVAGKGAMTQVQASFSLWSTHYSKEPSLMLVTKLPENNSSGFLNMHFDKER